MAGRPRKPTHLKLLEGTFRPDRAPENEPMPEAVAPDCPTWLHREAKREWKRIAPLLAELGLLTRIDRSALAAYCQLFARWYEAERAIKKHGMVMMAPWGLEMQRPEVGIAANTLKLMKAYLVEFGLTPSARSRINVAAPKGAPPGPDPWAEVM